MASNSKHFEIPGNFISLARTPTNAVTGNPLLSRTAVDVMCGFIPGLSGVAINAYRAAMPNGVKSPIDEIVRSLVTGAAGVPMTIRSTSALDVGPQVLLRSLGANFLPVANTTVTINGTTPVPILAGLPLTRINLAARTFGDFVGDILIENGGVTYAYIKAGEQSMRSSIYTVPAGYRFFLGDVMASLAKGGGAGVSCAMNVEIKPALSNGFGSLVAWNLLSDANTPAHFQQQYSQGLTGPLDLRTSGTTSAAGMDIQTLVSGILQDLSITA